VRDTAKSDAATARAERAYLARCRYRFRLACLSFAVAFVLIGGRLVTLGFAEEELVSGSLRDISSTVHRPDILDRRGRLLATDIKGATLYADPAKVIDVDELVEQVTSVLPDLNAAELRERILAGGRFVRIKRELTPKQQEEIHELGLPGLGFIDEYRRIYPMGATASHVVGLVDVDSKGLSGIEKFIDDNPQLAMSHPETLAGDEAVTISAKSSPMRSRPSTPRPLPAWSSMCIPAKWSGSSLFPISIRTTASRRWTRTG
jgi:cell division protein FtsI (penicillin-binding protein 3)